MEEEFIVKGAMATCQFGVAPAMLNNIMDNMNVYFNGKLAATSMTMGPVFPSPAFGTCNMVPNMPKPCVAMITKWDNVFSDMYINRISNPLTKNSKGTCALGCPMCISFQTTGQIPIPTVPQMEMSAFEHQSDMNLLAIDDLEEEEDDFDDPLMTTTKPQEEQEKKENEEKVERYERDFTYEQTSFSKKKNNKDVKKWTDKDGAEVDNPKSCNNLVLHYNKDFVPKNPKVNPPKPLRNEGKTDLMPWYGEDGIVEYYQKEGKIKDINPPVKDGKWDGSIPFNKDGVPDLEFLSRGTVTVGIKVYGENILKGKGETGKKKDGRDKNFMEANKVLARNRNPQCSPDEVAKWMDENGYTWHEMDENGTMQKVPSAVHGAVYHHGGVDLFKKLHEDGKLDEFEFSEDSNDRIKKKRNKK